MRYRVDTLYGWVSFDECDKEKAYICFREQGLNLRICRDLFDDGQIVEQRMRGFMTAQEGAVA